MGAWRAVGLNYINFSNIAARIVRSSLKPEFKVAAAKREETYIKFTPWKDGKSQKDKTF